MPAPAAMSLPKRVFAVAVLAACGAAACVGPRPSPPATAPPAAVAPPDTPRPPEATRPAAEATVPAAGERPATPSLLRVVAVGDLMLGSDYPDDRLPPDDGRGVLAAARALLRAADVAFGNLEGVLMDGGEPVKRCQDPASCYLFRSPARYARTFAEAGFDVLSLANNHARDFGEAGRSSSMAALDAAGIRHSGRAGDIASWEAQGLRLALIAFAPHPGAHDLLDIPAAATRIAQLAATHDIVIVSFHGGAEGAEARHVRPGMETFRGEARGDLIAFAHAVIDAGADLVLGHGPHVPRALELYRGRLIAYSLGNFATWYGISIQGDNGLAPALDVWLAADGRFQEGRIHSFLQRRPEGLLLDPARRAYALMRQLTHEDFGGGGLRFEDDGVFTPAAICP